MKKINIIQFLPYFPPHRGWLETHAEQFGEKYSENNFWKVFNVITDFDQDISLWEKIIFDWSIIWYKKNEVENLIIPSFEIIPNFPMYKIWSKECKLIKKYLKTKTSPHPSPSQEREQEDFIVITRTRFFLTSLIGWIFAKNNKIKWVHIEHGSDYVKLNSKLKTFIAKVYDKLIWKWIFKKANILVWVSNACKDFIQKEFINREVSVFYRWLEIPNKIKISDNLKEKFPHKIIFWFVGRLYKWKNIESFIKAYYLLDDDIKEKIQVVIVWDWEDFERLKKLDKKDIVYFTWAKPFSEALALQSQFDVHFHTSSPWGWLATTLLQAMQLWCFIVATPYEWASEVIQDWVNWILLNNDSIEELKGWILKALENIDKKEEFSKLNTEIIQEKFDWNENIKKYYDLFEK